MGKQVVMGASLKCSFGTATSTLVVLPDNKVLATMPAANIMDHVPMKNIPSFGMCQSVKPPVPCTPATGTPWLPGCPKVLIGNKPALESNSKCNCMLGGVIEVVAPGQKTVQVG
ncbi:DUF4280 domain-containing protein [Vitiosangium sp. GDMCC 1.1324]|uniref:DUF4280 domain-containing protein n=1 Tax=Vitiosangium sp. (strain GDMCC 1.1324) TaxID=2138576 RepID=UPI000D36BDF5|nr:DUF4280 domain-containing protein [Vitiosangium sp. GDMCC 1.1324]PTL80740.1 DUF4280 domain-containing protein [Vitiosangium sp. GDMCC 1.1324]